MKMQSSTFIFLHIFSSTLAGYQNTGTKETDNGFFPFRILWKYSSIQTYDQMEKFTLKYLCPAETTEDIALMEKYASQTSAGFECLLDKPFQDDEPKMCKNEPEPRFTLRFPADCHSDFDDDDYYRDVFGFSYLYCGSRASIQDFMKKSIKIPDSKDSFTYNICYNRLKNKTIYTGHKILASGLFNEDRLKKEQVYESSTISAKSFAHFTNSPFLKLQTAYENQPDSPDRVEPRLMVPKEHMIFNPEIRSTLHFINTAPLLPKLFPLMDLIDNRIKNFAIQKNMILTIYTTAFYNSFVGRARYIGERRNRFLIPNIWCKVVHYAGNMGENLGVAIIIVNALKFNYNLRNGICEKPYECNFQKWTDIRHAIIEDLEEHAFCCEVSEIIADFYPLKVNFNGVLPINERLDEDNSENNFNEIVL